MLFVLLWLAAVNSPANSYGSQVLTAGAKYPIAVSGLLASAKLEPMAADTVLIAEGIAITKSELMEKAQSQDPKVRGQLAKNLLFLLEQEVTRQVLVDAAKKDGISASKWEEQKAIRELLERKSSQVSVSNEETKAFFQANKEMVGGAPFEQVEDDIRKFLLKDKKQQAVSDYVAGLSQTVRLRVNESWMAEQSLLAVDNPVDKARGSKKPTMVEFGSTGCVPCDMMQPILDNLRKNYTEKLNVVFVHVGEEQVLAARYGIHSIPVQVFFDAAGKEVFRHVGFFPETEVTKQLSQLGVSK